MSRSSQDRLVTELRILEADDHRVGRIRRNAERGFYDDRHTPIAFPKMQLVADLRELGRHEELVARVIAGEFDTTREEWRS